MQLFLLFAVLAFSAAAQFGFFEQMFGGGGGGGEEHHHHHHQHQNNPSDASLYTQRYDQSVCDRYLCPDTLACVHFPHHCPCPWDANQDKFELGNGLRICLSKGGFRPGEAARKLELVRKGLL